MEVVVLTAVLAFAALFAASPQIPVLRRILRVPDLPNGARAEGNTGRPAEAGLRDHRAERREVSSRGVELKEITGEFVRVTAPTADPLALAALASTSGRFHRQGAAGLLYASSDPNTAWGELARSLNPRSESQPGAGHHSIEMRRRLSTLRVDSMRVLDLTDRSIQARLGVGLASLLSVDNTETQRLADFAREMGADGILAPSRGSKEATTLVLFAHARDRVRIKDSRLVAVCLPDAIEDPVIRARLSRDEQLLREFAAALRDERFDEWLDSLTTLTEDELRRLRSSGEALIG